MKLVELSERRLSWRSQQYLKLRLAGEGSAEMGVESIEIRIDVGESCLTLLPKCSKTNVSGVAKHCSR